MNAFQAMNDILTLNETIEKAKARNVGIAPSQFECDVVNLLTRYRELLVEEMTKTELQVFQHENQ